VVRAGGRLLAVINGTGNGFIFMTHVAFVDLALTRVSCLRGFRCQTNAHCEKHRKHALPTSTQVSFSNSQNAQCFVVLWFFVFGWQAYAWNMLFVKAVEVNALAQGALRQFTQYLWFEHTTFQLRGWNFTTELLPPPQFGNAALISHRLVSPSKTINLWDCKIICYYPGFELKRIFL